MGDEIVEAFWVSEGYEKPAEAVMPVNNFQRKLWELMEYPDSSLAARVMAFISIFVITTSVILDGLFLFPSTRPRAICIRLKLNDIYIASSSMEEQIQARPFQNGRVGCVFNNKRA